MKKIIYITLLFCLGISAVKAQFPDIFRFDTQDTTGCEPFGDLTISGNTMYGMTNSCGTRGWGCIFTININGTGYRNLFDFDGQNGGFPRGSLTLSGNSLYGMTNHGGAHYLGCIFSVNTNGNNYKILHSFNDTNGAGPQFNSSLVLIGKTLYGMVPGGGKYDSGCIFSIDTNGSGFRNLFDFDIATGGHPWGSLIIFGSKFFGMTTIGGAGGKGTVFSIDTNGNNYKVLLDFVGTNGYEPSGSLIMTNGKLYGMARSDTSYGLIFSLDTNGSNFNDLFDFVDGTDGDIQPEESGSLVLSGNKFFGMTTYGGNNNGVVFSIDTTGKEFKDLLFFDDSNGSQPTGDVTLSGSVLYGMTSSGGIGGTSGVIFKLDTNALAGIGKLNINPNVINLFPNPNNGRFILSLQCIPQKTEISVYNILGEEVYLSSLNSTTTQIDLSGKAEGLYLFMVITETGELVGQGKFVIQN